MLSIEISIQVKQTNIHAPHKRTPLHSGSHGKM